MIDIRNTYSDFMHDRINGLLFRITLGVIIVILGGILFFWNRLPPELPLYYSLPWGTEQIGTPIELVGLLIGSGILFFFNTILAIGIKRSQLFFSRLLFLSGIGIVFLAIITVVQILFLIT